MALTIRNPRVDELVDEVTLVTGESKTEAVRNALEERRQRLTYRTHLGRDGAGLLSFLVDEIWPQIPLEFLGTRLSKAEEEAILGYGTEGYDCRLFSHCCNPSSPSARISRRQILSSLDRDNAVLAIRSDWKAIEPLLD